MQVLSSSYFEMCIRLIPTLLLLSHVEALSEPFQLSDFFSINCPSVCMCRLTRQGTSADLKSNEGLMKVEYDVNCQRRLLQNIPRGIVSSTTSLFLGHNRLTALNGTTFRRLNRLRLLVLSNNRISKFVAIEICFIIRVWITSNAFYSLINLRELDLSNNLLVTISDNLFCPWLPKYFDSKDGYDETCSANRSSVTSLSLRLHGNLWHCSCYLQQFIFEYSCPPDGTNISGCLKFRKTPDAILKEEEDIGYCKTPGTLRGVPLQRLSSEEKKHEKRINLCLSRNGEVDVILLIVIFSWMGTMVAYVIHFVSWNNREIAHHKSYIASLEKSKECDIKSHDSRNPSTTVSTTKRRQEARSSSSRETSAKPDLAINDKLLENETSSNEDTLRSHPAPQPSPIWKPRQQVLTRAFST